MFRLERPGYSESKWRQPFSSLLAGQLESLETEMSVWQSRYVLTPALEALDWRVSSAGVDGFLDVDGGTKGKRRKTEDEGKESIQEKAAVSALIRPNAGDLTGEITVESNCFVQVKSPLALTFSKYGRTGATYCSHYGC